MKQPIQKLVAGISISLFFIPNLCAVVAGSNNSVSIQSQAFFPAADTDNMMNGFGWFQNGFTLENAATTCIFNSVFSVSGPLNLNGGTLILNRDVILENITTTQTFGTVIGNNHNLTLTAGQISFPASYTIFQDVDLILNTDIQLTSTILFKGNCVIHGQANTITLAQSGFILIDSNSSLKIGGTTILGVAGTNMQCIDDSASLILENTNIIQTGNFSFSHGSISYNAAISWNATSTFLYDSSQSSTIQSNAVVHLTGGFLLDIGRFNNTTTIEPFVFIDRTSFLWLDNGTLSVNQNGMTLTNGTIRYTAGVNVLTASLNAAHGLNYGNGNAANDPAFLFDAGCRITYLNSYVTLNVVSPGLLQPIQGGVTIVRQPGSVYSIEQSLIIQNITTVTNPPITTILAPGKTLELLNNTVDITGLGSYIINGFYINPTTQALTGDQNILLSGSLPLTTLVSNAGNIINGSGQILEPIQLQDTNAQLIWSNNGLVSSNIILNNGTLSLMGDLNLGHGISITGPGTVELNNQNLNIGYIDYDQGITWSGALAFDGSIGVINFNAGISLGVTWTINGDVIFVGNGNTLDLTDGQLVVAGAHSRMEFRNLQVTGVHGSNIQLLDNTQTLIINNTDVLLDDNYTFSTGAIRWQNTASLRGQNTVFVYESQQTFTVLSNSSLALDGTITFSYDSVSPNLFTFQDSTAQLFLNGSTLFAGPNGLNLRVGTMQVLSGGGTLASDSSITLGDCFNSANDFATVISNALTVESGTFNYKNVLASSWNMLSGSFWNFDDNTTLNIYQTINCGTAITTFLNNCTLGQANQAPCNATFNGPISGSPTVIDIPCC
jgi:hypothetical protein